MVKSERLKPVGGVYAALATPRCPDSNEADAAALFDYFDAIVRAGVDGIVLFGSTGEFVHFDLADRARVVTLASKRCRVPLLVNVSHSTLDGALDLAENAIDTCASGLLLMPPYYFRYTQEQIEAFYTQFAVGVAGRLPIYLYNIPMFTSPISAPLAERLLASGVFAGIKDSSGDWTMFETLQTVQARQPFQFFMGSDALYPRALPLGAAGAVSGVAAAVPEIMVSLDRTLRAGRMERARQLETRLREFIDWADKLPVTLAIKRAAVLRRWKLDHTSTPLDAATAADVAAFEKWFQGWLPAVLSETRLE